ncbi:four-carbon acid sugar kinase family protein [Seonamhaeicola sp.]|uniref:four-carbon acid sugar kinase family protein n=1 Tax=Seonamhaeicola sp. TaxID=1912245 RepID=UPI0026268C55|nr:four-carbon acid sugar kinase family protein [Seonamhaeicola sp.]
MQVSLSNILAELPKEEHLDYRTLNRSLFTNMNKACIVVDDDPTGNQTVYDIPLLTRWDVDTLVAELKQSSVCFLLTNSRSLSAEETAKTYKGIGENILEASRLAKKDITIISRSDSTLRGHFPLEPQTLKDALHLNEAITVFIPVMFEGKRVTVNDTHYIKDDETLTPVSETPFAQDHSFKYTTSDLKGYIEEKSGGRIKSSEVYSFGLNAIREKSIETLSEQILKIPANSYCIFNSLNYADLDKVTHALLQAEKLGKQIIYRTSSSFVPSYIGLKPKGLLNIEDIQSYKTSHGGLTVVGSYVKKSSEQLQEALKLFNTTTTLEVDVEQVLGNNSDVYLNAIIIQIGANLKTGKDTIVFTSRKLITGTDVSSTINLASTISNALVSIINGLCVRPKYLIAKGGITSHDLAVKGLEMKRSEVIGQIQPGIPVWKMGEETKFPNLPYVVFPGNVGTTETLKQVITKLN